ncbi:MAG: phytanoyl-CoA dioxygenase family protein [Thiolinea sp.]
MQLSEQHIQAYQQDGAILVKKAISDDWVERLNRLVDYNMTHPSRYGNDRGLDERGGRLFTDRYQWRDNDTIREFVFHSGIGDLVRQAMQSTQVRFYFDHLLVKEPNTVSPSPWHQDTPYWPFLGRQIGSAWVALSDVTVAESSLEFIRGSHRDEIVYRPEVFGKTDNNPSGWIGNQGGQPVPDIEADRAAYDILGFDVEAGDAIIFSAWTLHGSRGNDSPTKRRAALSTRWLGDDAIWHPHEGADPTVTQADVCVQPGEKPHDDDRFPLLATV